MMALWTRLSMLEQRFEKLVSEVARLKAYIRELEERLRTISRAG